MKPLLSVGLAVYNGERYLREALDSILNQTMKDFELIISDNASTDATEEICRSYARRDSRIKYHRNAFNIGGANNENQTFQYAEGKYFRWAAYDDICAPTLFENCIDILESHDDIVLCCSLLSEIDENGKHIRTILQSLGTADKPHKRFRSLMRLDHNCQETYGIIRSDVLRKTKLQQNYTDSDRTLLCELALHGKYYQIPEILFYRRIHPGMSTIVFPNWLGRMAWFGDGATIRSMMPHWLQFIDYLRVISISPANLSNKIMCYFHMVTWLFSDGYRSFDGHGRWMLGDLKRAIIYWFKRVKSDRTRS